MNFFKAALLLMVAIQSAFIGMLFTEGFGSEITWLFLSVMLFNVFCIAGIIYITYQTVLADLFAD